jgi:hypothetical protein
MDHKTDRRGFLNATLLGAAGAGAALGLEEKILMAAVQEGTPEAAKTKPDINPSTMPCGKIGNVKVSRLLIGGNLIGGWAHSRDLIYVSRLFQAYNTEAKVFETLEIAEQCGINMIQMDPRCWDVLLKYRKERGGKMQAMLCFMPDADRNKMGDTIKGLVDKGAELLYVHGEMGDRCTMTGRVDILAMAVELVKAQGVPAGIGSHSLETPMACEQQKINPDYYVKTFHMDRYWSATPKEERAEWCWQKGQSEDHDAYHDNMFCLDAEKTAQFMATVEKPWVAFKVMAAGAIHPRMAFPHAFRNGADFVIAGMFDFQVEQDAKLVISDVPKFRNRARPWRG